MKQFFTLVTTLILVLSFSSVQAQCVPDSTVPPIPGIYPDSFPDAEGCVFYDLDVTFYLPRDTTVSGLGTFDFNYFIIDDVVGLPLGMSWVCNNQPDCIYDVSPGNPNPDTLGCVNISGTPTIPGVYNVTVYVIANLPLVGDQVGTYNVPLVVTPCASISDCYTLNLDSNCEPATLDATNEIGITGNPGVSYFWDFGNGYTTTDPNPTPQTYTAGTYIVSQQTIIDTIGFILNDVTINSINCGDGVNGAEVYWELYDPNGNLIVSGPNTPDGWIEEPLLPLSTGISSVFLNTTGIYSFQVWDDDSGLIIPNAPDGCATGNEGAATNAEVLFSVPPTSAGTFNVSNGGLDVSFTIINPIDTVFCSDTITIDALPSKPTIVAAGDTTFCVGDSVVLVTTSTDSIQWELDGVPIVGANGSTYAAMEEGLYTVSVINQRNCRATSAGVLVMVNETDEPNISLVDCELSTSAVGVTFQWYQDGTPIPGATSFTYEATANASYYIEVTNQSTGCSAISQTVTANCGPAALEELYGVLENLNLYPNPTSTSLHIQFQLIQSQNVELELNDVYGKQIMKKSFANQFGEFDQELDLSTLPKGIYLINIHMDKGSVTKKVVVE